MCQNDQIMKGGRIITKWVVAYGTLEQKLRFVKSQRSLSNVSRFKDRLAYDLVASVVYKFQCGRCNIS